MPFKLAANLTFMFKEHSKLLQRYEAAKRAGFKGVECAFLYDFPLNEVVEAKKNAGVEQVLINSWPGDQSKGERGIAALPDRKDEFAKTLETSIEYAKALNCKKLHIVAGKKTEGLNDDEMNTTFDENLKIAVSRLEKFDMIGLIEPINSYSLPSYYMNSFDKALKIVKKFNSPHLKLQLDIFHLQHICGNLTNNIKSMLPFVGHIQIAQVPDRHEPNTPGEIDYRYIFELLSSCGYEGWIGCEYQPKNDTVQGLDWISQFSLGF